MQSICGQRQTKKLIEERIVFVGEGMSARPPPNAHVMNKPRRRRNCEYKTKKKNESKPLIRFVVVVVAGLKYYFQYK